MMIPEKPSGDDPKIDLLVEKRVRAMLPRILTDLFSGMIYQALGRDSQLAPQPSGPPFISLEEVARRLGLRYQTLKNKNHLGTLPFKTEKVGRIPMVHRDVFAAYLDSIRVEGLRDLTDKRRPSPGVDPSARPPQPAILNADLPGRKQRVRGQLPEEQPRKRRLSDSARPAPASQQEPTSNVGVPKWKQLRNRANNIAYRENEQRRKQALKEARLPKRAHRDPPIPISDTYIPKPHWTKDPTHPTFIRKQRERMRKLGRRRPN